MEDPKLGPGSRKHGRTLREATQEEYKEERKFYGNCMEILNLKSRSISQEVPSWQWSKERDTQRKEEFAS